MFKKLDLNKKRVLIIIIAVVFSLAICGSIWYFFIRNSNQNGADNLTNEEVISKSENLDFIGKSSEAISILDKAIANTKSNDEKFELLIKKSTILYNNDDVDNAIKAAIASYNAKQTLASSSLVGLLARKKGDIVLAKQYYNIALGLAGNSDDILAGSDKIRIQDILDELEKN